MDNIKALEAMARTVRRDILTMVHEAGSGHPGGSLSAADIMVALYFSDIFRCDPQNPDDPKRDRFLLSKGHTAPVLYSVLCRKGFFDESHLHTLRKLDSILQGHPHAEQVPGVDCSSGSLGQGLSIANGLAMGLRKQGRNSRVYCLMGDGELQEGQVWEAALTAAQHKLSNVCAMVDNNHVQLDGTTDSIKGMEPVTDKFAAFGWNVIPVDGHSIPALLTAFRAAQVETERPTVLVCETVKGKGVSFMEGQAAWHGNAPSAEQLARALSEIDSREGDAV